MKYRYLFIISTCLFMACNGSGSKEGSQAASSTATTDTSTPQAAEGTGSKTDSSTAKVFDISKIPVSDAPLGDFPYVRVPDGYSFRNTGKPKDFDHFPFWVGDHFEWAEGKLYESMIEAKNDKEKEFSSFEVGKSLDKLIRDAGGIKVFDGKIPSDSAHTLSNDHQEIAMTYVDGLGDIYNRPAIEYVIHRKDKDIWIHLCLNDYSGGIVILETKALGQTVGMIPADDLKRRINAIGKATASRDQPLSNCTRDLGSAAG